MSEQQRRKSPRFPINRKVAAKAADGTDILGVARDVNAEGVFFFTDAEVAQGAKMEILLNLPAGTIFSDNVSLRAIGKIVRVEQTPNGTGRAGIAVAFEHIEISHSSSAR